MANLIQWGATWTSRGSVLTPNSLGIGARTDGGTVVDNDTNLDQYGCLDIVIASVTVPAGAPYLTFYLLNSADGTNYSEGSSTVDPGTDTIIATIPLRTGTVAHRKVTPVFRLPTGKLRFIVYNGSGVALAAAGNTVTLYTANDEVQ